MRIAIITGTKNFGGAEHHAVKLAEWLSAQPNTQVEFWGYTNQDIPLIKAVEKGIMTRIITHFLRFQKGIAFFRQLYHYRKQIRQFKPDAIIAFNVLPTLWVGLAGKFAGVPVRIWSQQSVYEPKAQYSKAELRSMKNITAFISNAHHLSDHLRENLPVRIDRKHFYVVGNGISTLPQIESDDYWHAKLRKDQSNFIVTMVANLTSMKDHDTLIDAWKLVIDQTKDTSHTPLLALAGRLSDTYDSIRNKVETLDLSEHVLFLDMVNDIGGLNKHSDLGVLSSRAEGLPNSVMEQMLAGLPIVGTNNAGTVEAVGDEMEQYLSPIGDPKDLANKILFFMNDASRRETVGKKNQQRIKEHFSVEQMGKGTLKIIQKYLA